MLRIMKRLVTYFFLLCFAAVLAGSCKKLSVDTIYNLKVEWQERRTQKDTLSPLADAKVYAFFADPEQWEVTTIEDARNGVITKIDDPSQKRNYDEAPAGTGQYRNQFEFKFNGAPVMLVVADNQYPMWATGNANIVPDLPYMYVTLQFRPLDWKEGDKEPIVKKPWKYYGYENVVIPIDTKLQIVPAVWVVGGASSTVLKSSGCYAFYGVTKKMKGEVASWDNARAGIINMTGADGNTVQKNFDVKGEWKNDSLLMDIKNPSIMVVAYNEVPEETGGRRIYAYTFFDLSSNAPEVSSNVLFNLKELTSSEETTVTYNTWTVVYGKVETAKR